MSKISRLFAILMLVLVLVPNTFADSDKPLKIKDADFEVRFDRLKGSTTICNNENENIRFTLEVKNLTINSLYNRNFYAPAGECKTYRLRFKKDFALMSNADDEIQLVAKKVSSFFSRKSKRKASKYQLSNKFITDVEEGDNRGSSCADKEGNDDIFSLCVGSFVYHEPTGLRIRLHSKNGKKAVLMITHVKWGGVKKVVLYRNRSKTITAKNDMGTRVKISNLYGSGNGQKGVLLKIES